MWQLTVILQKNFYTWKFFFSTSPATYIQAKRTNDRQPRVALFRAYCWKWLFSNVSGKRLLKCVMTLWLMNNTVIKATNRFKTGGLAWITYCVAYHYCCSHLRITNNVHVGTACCHAATATVKYYTHFQTWIFEYSLTCYLSVTINRNNKI